MPRPKKERPAVPPDGTIVTAWVTRYGLTEGIRQVTGRVFADGTALSYGDPETFITRHAHVGDWHMALSDAKDAVESSRVAKLESLKRSIKRLEDYTPPVIRLKCS